MRRALLITALALLVPPPAAAKEITAAHVCGSAGCTDVDLSGGMHEFPGSGVTWSGPAPAGPFVEVRLTFDRMHAETVWYVLDADFFALPDGTGRVRWAPPADQRLDRLIIAAARTVRPYRPRVTDAYVDGKRVAGDVSGYLALFAPGPDVSGRDHGDGFVSISLTTSPRSPWELTRLWFYPDTGSLFRATETVELPRYVADDLRAGRLIDGPNATGGFDWPLVTGSLTVALALALGAAVLARRRPETAI